jgi:hypothetical protein
MAENTYPTIADLHKVLTTLVEGGLGELPIQIVIAPDSTIQVLAQRIDEGKPALMIEYHPQEGRQPVAFISTARLNGDIHPMARQ